MPSCSSDISNSLSEHIIPSLLTSLIFEAFKLIFNPGIKSPGVATTTFIPLLTFGAPQTILSIPMLDFTSHTFNLSAFGCFSTFSISPTDNCPRDFLGSTRDSTSNPVSVRTSPTSSAEKLVSR